MHTPAPVIVLFVLTEVMSCTTQSGDLDAASTTRLKCHDCISDVAHELLLGPLPPREFGQPAVTIQCTLVWDSHQQCGHDDHRAMVSNVEG